MSRRRRQQWCWLPASSFRTAARLHHRGPCLHEKSKTVQPPQAQKEAVSAIQTCQCRYWENTDTGSRSHQAKNQSQPSSAGTMRKKNPGEDVFVPRQHAGGSIHPPLLRRAHTYHQNSPRHLPQEHIVGLRPKMPQGTATAATALVSIPRSSVCTGLPQASPHCRWLRVSSSRRRSPDRARLPESAW